MPLDSYEIYCGENMEIRMLKLFLHDMGWKNAPYVVMKYIVGKIWK